MLFGARLDPAKFVSLAWAIVGNYVGMSAVCPAHTCCMKFVSHSSLTSFGPADTSTPVTNCPVPYNRMMLGYDECK